MRRRTRFLPNIPLVGGGGGGGELTDDGFYIYTHEPVDGNTLLAEDFSRGSWYTKNCDDANGSGGLGQDGVHGWCGTIYANAYLAARPGAVVDLGGGEYAGATGNIGGGDNNGNMADHNLKEYVRELWIRFYTKPLSNWVVGAEKMLTINTTVAGSGGITVAGLGSGGGDGAAWTNCPVWDCNGPPNIYYYRQNQGGAPWIATPGSWQFVEVHCKLNSDTIADGEYRLWLADCGTGTLPVNPGGSPTLRAEHTGIRWVNPTGASAQTVKSLWWECWSNPVTTGERYLKEIYVSKAGPVGFSTRFNA